MGLTPPHASFQTEPPPAHERSPKTCGVPRDPPTVVFDLDGTLVHTSPDIAAALNAVLAPHGRAVTLAETERMIGDGLHVLFHKALKATSVALDGEQARKEFEKFAARYRRAPAVMSSAHPWVVEAMIALHGESARLAVCTNKAEDIAVAILENLDLTRWLHAVVGHAPGREKKPSAALVHLAIDAAGGAANHAVFVGDSRTDVEAARNAGLPIVLVPHGYGAEAPASLGADRIVTTAGELRAAVAEFATAGQWPFTTASV